MAHRHRHRSRHNPFAWRDPLARERFWLTIGCVAAALGILYLVMGVF